MIQTSGELVAIAWPLTLLALGSLLLRLRAITLYALVRSFLLRLGDLAVATYLLIRLVVLVPVVTEVILLLIVLVLEFALVVVIELLELKSLAGEPVDSTGDELLLDILAELVVQLQTLLDVGRDLVIIVGRGLGWREKVEERLGGDRLLDNAGLLRV